MKIVLATTAVTRGGVWRHVEDLGIGLRNSGHEVVVGLRPDAHELARAADQAGLATAEHARTIGWRSWIWHGHLHDTFDRDLIGAAVRRRLIHAPTVLTEHLPHTNASDPSLQPGHRHPFASSAKTLFKRIQFVASDHIIAVSPSSKDFLEARYGRRGSKIDVVMHGVAEGSVSGPPLAHEGPVRVVCVGSVIYQKGHDLLVDAGDRGHVPNWRATVLGEGPARAHLQRRAAARGVVRFPGWSDDVSAEIEAADIVCMPSRWESAGYAALEAMAAGRPVIATAVDGLRDIVANEVTGILVTSEDVGGLARALDRLAADAPRRLEMGLAGRDRVRQFTIPRMVEETVRIYRELSGTVDGG